MARLRAEVKNLRVPGTPRPQRRKISGSEPCCGAAALRGSAAGAVAPQWPPGGISVLCEDAQTAAQMAQQAEALFGGGVHTCCADALSSEQNPS